MFVSATFNPLSVSVPSEVSGAVTLLESILGLSSTVELELLVVDPVSDVRGAGVLVVKTDEVGGLLPNEKPTGLNPFFGGVAWAAFGEPKLPNGLLFPAPPTPKPKLTLDD